jgi:hypothetical protein
MKLTKTDLEYIEEEAARLVAASSPSPFAATMNRWGQTVTIGLSELIQSFALPIILVIFAALEFARIRAGSLALGQSDDKAMLLAMALVTANVVHPIYTLRNRGDSVQVIRHTLKSRLQALRHWITGDKTVTQVGHDNNTLLNTTATIITITTILLAVMDVLAPIIQNGITQSSQWLDLIVGVGISFGGVLFLQSAAHEIGLVAYKLRTLTMEEARAQAREERMAQKESEYVLKQRVKKAQSAQLPGSSQPNANFMNGQATPSPTPSPPPSVQATHANGKHANPVA